MSYHIVIPCFGSSQLNGVIHAKGAKKILGSPVIRYFRIIPFLGELGVHIISL